VAIITVSMYPLPVQLLVSGEGPAPGYHHIWVETLNIVRYVEMQSPAKRECVIYGDIAFYIERQRWITHDV